jgi:hypothetical protein
MTITSSVLKKFVALAIKRLKGDWVVIGGTVLPLIKIDERVTVDIDIAKVDRAAQDQTLELMEIAEEIGLPVEAINQAGSFFLHRIPHWKSKLILVSESKSARIYRPNGTLFLQLKISRLSASDFSDCLAMIRHCAKVREPLETTLLLKTIENEISKSTDDEKSERLRQLKTKVRA